MEEPIRVLNLFTIMNRGGAETMVMNYYRNIDRTKVQFDFLVHRQERGAYDDEIEALGGRIYRMPAIYPQNFAKYKKLLASFFTEHKEYKIVHSHMSELGYFAFKKAEKYNIPIRICHAHNTPSVMNLKMMMRIYMKKKMLPYITHMFTCSHDSAVWLYGKKYENNFIQLNNAINTQDFVYDENIETSMRRNFGLENEFVVGHVGRFAKQKNHERLVKIFEQILKIKENSVLVLVGSGDFNSETKLYIEKQGLDDKIIKLGSRDDVSKIYQMFDIFLFPSLHEGLSVSMVEAQTAGLQCFISDSISKQCIITDNVITFSLDDKDETIAQDILNKHHLFKKENMYNKVCEAGFDIKNNAKWLEEFYINEYNNTK